MTAIIPAAGKGTRFLPATRVIPKEMLPIGAKPAIHRIVEEAIEAGVDDIVIVISKDKEIIREYFEGDEELKDKIHFAYQLEQKGLGHAVLQAAEFVHTREVLIMLGDALVSGPNPSKMMKAVWCGNGAANVIGMEVVPPEMTSRYGIAAVKGGKIPSKGDYAELADLVEKPAPGTAPSNLAVAGRYVMHRAIFDFLATQKPGHGGEIQLTDAIRRLMELKKTFGYVYEGKRQDIGNPHGYFKALEAFNGNC